MNSPLKIGVCFFALVALVCSQSYQGTIYVLSNQGINQILAFPINLTPLQYSEVNLTIYSTGGNGTATASADPLGSSDSLILNSANTALFAVNSGSNQVTSFAVGSNGILTQADLVSSNGTTPVSLAYYNYTQLQVLFVLNAGQSGSVQGFSVSANLALTPIPGSQMSLQLNSSNPAPSQIGFSKDGTQLIVVVKAGSIITFSVNTDGSLKNEVTTPYSLVSNGTTPFSFVQINNQIFITDASSKTVSSVSLLSNGSVTSISNAISNGAQAAPCWIASSNNYLIIANAGSGSLGIFSSNSFGQLTLFQAAGSNFSTGIAVLDLAAAQSGGYQLIFARISSNPKGGVAAFQTQSNGILTSLGYFLGTAVPYNAQGIAGFITATPAPAASPSSTSQSPSSTSQSPSSTSQSPSSTSQSPSSTGLSPTSLSPSPSNNPPSSANILIGTFPLFFLFSVLLTCF